MEKASKKFRVFQTIDEAYKACYKKYVAYAHGRLANKNEAEDVVQDAFAYSLKYSNEHPHKNVLEYLIFKEIQRNCRRKNQEKVFQLLEDYEDNNEA